MPGGALDRMVHDLFGPLTVIRGVCATLARDEPPGERRAGLALIDAETLRLAAGLEGITRASAGPPAGPPRSPVCLGRLSAGVAERHRAAGRARDVAVTAVVRGAPPTVIAAEDDLRRALDNLVQNALRHAAGEVRIAVGRRGRFGHVRVADDGLGVPPGDRDRIFRAGERGTAPCGEGQGLGLAIAREIAERHGGRLSLDAVGPGASFRLALPLAAGARAGGAAA